MRNPFFQSTRNIAGAWALFTIEIIITAFAYLGLVLAGVTKTESILITAAFGGILAIIGAIWVDRVLSKSKKK